MQKTAYEMRIRDWSSDVCSSDLVKHGSRLMNEAAGGDYRRMADLEPCQSWMGHCALEWSRAGGDRKMLGAFYRPADDWETTTDPRSEERRVGKEGVSTGRTRGEPYT